MTDTPPPTGDSEPSSVPGVVPDSPPAPPAAAPARPAPPSPAADTAAPAVAWQSPEHTDGPAPGVEFAPHGQRLVAYILDGLIITAVCGILVLIGTILLYSGSTVVDNRITDIEPGAVTGFVLLTLGAIVIALLYFPWFWARGGQTLGMRPFSLRVVSDRDGGRIGWGTAWLRLVGMWVAGAVFYIGVIWIFIDKRRRGWQDLIANTLVIKQG